LLGKIYMSEVVDNAPQEFWRPPVAPAESVIPAMVEACDRCETEFMIGARFCHGCGAERRAIASTTAAHLWGRAVRLLRVLEFQNVKEWLGLSMASLIAFFAGVGCLLAAIAVGAIYSVQTLADFQAIQSWRIQWLLAALAAFAAGILLKQAGVKEK
jgi:MFS family permease